MTRCGRGTGTNSSCISDAVGFIIAMSFKSGKFFILERLFFYSAQGTFCIGNHAADKKKTANDDFSHGAKDKNGLNR